MTPRTRRGLFYLALAVAILAVLLVQGCASVYPYQPEMTRPVNGFIESRVIHVRWYEDENAVNDACAARIPEERAARLSRIFACSWTFQGSCYILAMLPADYNDAPRLAFLGHEVIHCFGSKHGGW